MHAAYSALGRFTVRYRWLVLLSWLVVIIGSFFVFPSLNSVVKANNSDFLPKKAPSEIASELASPLQNSNFTPVPIVVSATSGKLTAADAPYVQSLITALGKVNHVKQVRDLGSSPDGVANQIQTLADINLGQDGPSKTLVDDLTTAVKSVRAPPGVRTNVAGQLADQIANEEKSGNTANKIQFLTLIFIFLLLVLIFRSPLAPLITLLPALLISLFAGRVVAELTHAGLQVSSLSQIMLIILVLGAGTDYALFLIFRVREEIRSGLPPREAIVRSVERVGESITFSASTVIAALLTLLAATFGIYSSLGAPLAIAIFLMLLAGLTLLPALLAIFGRAVFWPIKLKPEVAGQPPLWGRVAGRVIARPVVTLVVGILAFGGLSVAVLGYTAAGFGNSVAAPNGSAAKAGDDVLTAHFPKAAANPTNVIFKFNQPVWTQPAELDQAQTLLSKASVFNQVTGPTTPNGAQLGGTAYQRLHNEIAKAVPLGDPRKLPAVQPAGVNLPAADYALYRSEANYVSRNGETVQYLASLTVGDPASTKALHTVPQIRTEVYAVGAQVHAAQTAVGGEAPAFYDIAATSDHDLKTVIPIAIVIIAILLALVMRSLVAPLYLIVSVALSYCAALGLCVLVFQKLAGHGGLTFFLPFLMFIFLLALGEDYNILVMTRIREEAHDVPLREAVRHAVGATGSTVTSAGLVLAGTFAVFAVVGSQMPGGQQFADLGAGLAIGILMDTFLVRTLLVPSTVAILGRWNWWPSDLHDRHKDTPEQPA
ncbi:MAG TPA: MMPL family transporter [Mycobacteriales bacterium]|nr:MMPL family transporter [Mycobacteriales bacterium]